MNSENLDLEKYLKIEDLKNIVDITKSIIITSYKFNDIKEVYEFNFNPGLFDTIPVLKNATATQKKIIKYSISIIEIIDNLFEDFLKNTLSFQNIGAFVDSCSSITIEGFLERKIIVDETIKDINSELFTEYKKLYKILLLQQIKTYKIECIKFYEVFINDKPTYKNTDNTTILQDILNKTIKKGLKEVEKTNADEVDKNEYIKLWNDIFYIWRGALINKKRPNKFYLALEELLKYSEIKRGVLHDLYISIVRQFNSYCSKNDKYKAIILTLCGAFITDKIEYNETQLFIKSLATTSFKDKKIMDKRTFDKKYKELLTG